MLVYFVTNKLLAGGMSHFSNHWGLAADNLDNVEVQNPLPQLFF